MSVELPGEVVWFLNLIGVNWPNVDEDQVRAFAGHVRDFANSVDGTHRAASSTLKQMGEAYTGSSYEQLVETWSRMSDDHMTELVDACHVVATALDVAAEALIVEAGEKLINGLIQQLEQHIVGEVITMAVGPLEQTVERALGGLVFKGLEGALGVPAGAAGGVGDSFGIMPDALLGHAAALRGHADAVADHASAFASNISSLNFGD